MHICRSTEFERRIEYSTRQVTSPAWNDALLLSCSKPPPQVALAARDELCRYLYLRVLWWSSKAHYREVSNVTNPRRSRYRYTDLLHPLVRITKQSDSAWCN